MFTVFTTSKTSYNCHLSTRAVVKCERILGDNPINIMMSFADGKLPKLETLLTILWAALEDYNHGIKREDIYDIFDDYVAAGGSMGALMDFIATLFSESGLIGKADGENETEDDDAKN